MCCAPDRQQLEHRLPLPVQAEQTVGCPVQKTEDDAGR